MTTERVAPGLLPATNEEAVLFKSLGGNHLSYVGESEYQRFTYVDPANDMTTGSDFIQRPGSFRDPGKPYIGSHEGKMSQS